MDTDKLKRLAEAAGNIDKVVEAAHDAAKFMSACSPETVLALIAENEGKTEQFRLLERKPISEAPKDGAKVLLWVGNEACTGQWDAGVGHYDCEKDEWIEGGWGFDRLPAHGCGCCANDDTQPTHYSEIDQ